MSIQVAAAIVQRLGPCRIALHRTAHADFARELALLGCETVDIDARPEGRTAGFLQWRARDAGPAFAEALKPFAALDLLVLATAGQPRHPIEQALFDAGWRRHAAGMMASEYGAWSATQLPPVSYYARARADEGFSVLGMPGVAADAVIARYAVAAQHVRPGDHVLIDGEAPADGAAILAALSRAGRISRLDTEGGDTARIPDHGIDMIVAFEPPSRDDWTGQLAHHARILKYDGRLILGWRKAPGDNSRPADWDVLRGAVAQWLLPEMRYVQRAASRDLSGPHVIQQADMDQPIDGAWFIIMASANPLAGEGHGAGYDHPAFPRGADPLPTLVDFGAAYDNPWLYRVMVQMGERLGHDVTLARLAECVAEDSRGGSADQGAALAVLGYRILEMRRPDLVAPIVPAIEAYVGRAGGDAPAHVQRWCISLAFLAGRLCELTGERPRARRWYGHAARADWRSFSPLLATKSIAAAFFDARLCLAEGDLEAARASFSLGLETALAATGASHATGMGSPDRPLPFYMQELAEVIDMGSQCANALAHLPLWQRDPGLFWRQADVRRFGLASWARDLERENNRLRAA